MLPMAMGALGAMKGGGVPGMGGGGSSDTSSATSGGPFSAAGPNVNLSGASSGSQTVLWLGLAAAGVAVLFLVMKRGR